MAAFFYQDLTDRARFGLAGGDAAGALAGFGAVLPADVFGWALQRDGSLVARLSPVEFLWLGNPTVAAPVLWEKKIGESSDCYVVHWRSSHAWFAIGGESAVARLAEICDLDVTTITCCQPVMLARIPAWIFYWSIPDVPYFHLLVPGPHANAIWDWIVAPHV